MQNLNKNPKFEILNPKQILNSKFQCFKQLHFVWDLEIVIWNLFRISCLLVVTPSLLANPVINEVMANPKGLETGNLSPGDRNEFVEIYNSSDEPIDLNGVFLQDASDKKDSLITFMDPKIQEHYPGVIIGTTLLNPESYALILDQEYLSEDTIYYLPYAIPSGTLILTTDDSNLGDGLSGTDPLILLKGEIEILSTYTPFFELDDGVSCERRDPQGLDNESNWLPSRTGATPGAKNSVTLTVDLVIEKVNFTPPTPNLGEEVSVLIQIANFGLNSIDSFELYLTSEPVNERRLITDPLARDESDSVAFDLGILPEGYWNLDFQIKSGYDEDTTNNYFATYLKVGSSPLVINEIMYDDTSEWVELYNRSDKTVSLLSFYLQDKANAQSGPFEPLDLTVGDYLVVINDSMAFKAKFSQVKFSQPEGGIPTLNNSDETIYLYDAFGTVLDSVAYKSSWGGGKGVSLERLSPQLASTTQANWSSCRDQKGGTPGRANSILVSYKGGEELLAFSSKIFSPNGDGEGDFLVISYTIPNYPAQVNIKIFDMVGRLVKRLYVGESANGKGEVIWDGTNDNQNYLQTGLYIVYLEAKSGSKRYKEKKTVVLKRF